ncbi:Ribosomal protein S4 [Rickettsiales bacterium Ac37b]|nr:Ribosomal protein S4 [Rickettsiales bacterium Ac37b]
MTKIQTVKYKRSRQLGVNLWGRAKDPYNTRNYPRGQHGPTANRKSSDYGTQLRAKQQLRGYYGDIPEKQFRKIFQTAIRMKGDTGENLIGLLERRLDSVVYRLNFGITVFAARQLVSHKHIKVNGRIVNVGSYRVKDGDIIEVAEKSKGMLAIVESLQKMERDIPEYMEVNTENMQGKFLRIPKLADVPYPVLMAPNLVVEYYSR